MKITVSENLVVRSIREENGSIVIEIDRKPPEENHGKLLRPRDVGDNTQERNLQNKEVEHDGVF